MLSAGMSDERDGPPPPTPPPSSPSAATTVGPGPAPAQSGVHLDEGAGGADEQGADPGPTAAGSTAPKADRLFVHSRTEHGAVVIRQRDGNLEVGEIRPLAPHRPIVGDAVRLRPTDTERVFDIETLHETKVPPPLRKGPAKVTTQAYRRRWDAIFGAARSLPEAPPSDEGPDPSALN